MGKYELSEKEKKVMFCLYRLGETTVGSVAKDTLINRTTLYPILNSLLSKGLVSKVGIEDKTFYKPISLEDFKNWVKERKEEAERENSELLGWIDTYQTKKQKTLLSDMSYFEGLEGVKKLYADTWRDNKGKLIYAITDYKSAYETMSEFFIDEYFSDRVRHQVRVKNLIPESKEGRRDLKDAKKLLREMKFIKLFEDLEIEMNIYDSKVALVAFDKEKPSGVLIKNEKVASALKNIFEYLWKHSS